jgi:hypothetical protein
MAASIAALGGLNKKYDQTTGRYLGIYDNNNALVFPAPATIPATNDSAGINAAIAAVVASGRPGTVLLDAADYTITTPISLKSNVSLIGVPPALVMIGNVPDAGFTTNGGTRFIVSPGVTALYWNNVDKGSDETNIATFACTGVTCYGITFLGGAKAIDTGAYRAMGVVWSEFDQLFAFDQTSDFAFDFKNFQHTQFGRLYTSTTLTTGSGVRFASQLSSTLLPGNSQVVGEVYTYCANRLNRSIVIEASGPAGCILNQFKVSGRLQGNRYGAGSPDIIAATANATANFAVPDGTKFQVGMPVVFHSTAPTNYTVDVVYFVASIASNVITLRENPYDTVDLVAGNSGSFNLSVSGWPSREVRAPNTANSIKNSDFGHIDAEAVGNVCAVLFAKTRNCQAFIAELSTSSTGTGLVCRDAEIGIAYNGIATITQDLSANFGFVSVQNNAGGPYVLAAAAFTPDSGNNCRNIRYTGTTDFTVTPPTNLPKGYWVEITTGGATGIITFAAPAGGAILALGGKLRTGGQNATVRLKNIANKVYSLSGDTQV